MTPTERHFMADNVILTVENGITYETSCGAVVYTYENGVRKYVIIQSLEGYHGFPKGHITEGETEHETALREILEETSLRPTLIDGFRAVDEHPLPKKPNVTKRVVYFLAEYTNQTIVPQVEELREARLMTFDEAMASFEFDSPGRVLSDAEAFLNSRN